MCLPRCIASRTPNPIGVVGLGDGGNRRWICRRGLYGTEPSSEEVESRRGEFLRIVAQGALPITKPEVIGV